MKARKAKILPGLVMACTLTACPFVPPPPPAEEEPVQNILSSCEGNSTFNIGAGIYDITGPAAEVGMMGYAVVDQKTEGIHMRLRSRAYVIESPCNGKRVVFVSADLGQIFQAVKQGVVRKLNDLYGDFYSDANVLLSATHTHSGPGGYSHYALYNFTILGFDSQGYNAIVNGIVESIVRAHDNIQPGTLKLNSGDLLDASFNRSPWAYEQNPQSERDRYAHNTDKNMTLLKMGSTDGQEIGMVAWFAVHSTNIGNTNKLISGDNKGLAAYYFEKEKGATYLIEDQFIASFAQSNEGDVSPNLWGHPDGTHDYDRNEIIARRQFEKARDLYTGANRVITGGVDYRHRYVDFSSITIDPRWTNGAGQQETCPAAIGLSFAAGSTEDGAGLDFISEGMVYDGVSWPAFTLVPALQECHKEKIIALPTGTMSPFPWTPEVLPVQIVLVGNLALVAVPFECTTMCGRRLREMVADTLSSRNVSDVVIAGLSNAYAGYVSTREEYAVQHYEGASTHFGPWTHAAFMQEFHRVADALNNRASIGGGPTPRDLSDHQSSLITGVVFDDKPLFKNFGDVASDANSSYSKGQSVRVVFWGAHPKNNLKTQSTYLEVQRWNGSSWQTVARDWDPETIYH
ncbi:MAG: neutral/alkaline ceramidase, partial [Leptospiraceae bacterium]|nr:neutral/alkaline ceramidase [Leptospiraceae bacterium]